MKAAFDVLTFREADLLLKKSSATYKEITDFVRNNGGYGIISENMTEFFGCWDAGRRVVTIRTEVRGAQMVSVLAFEMTNAFQQSEHDRIDIDARNGIISQEQFVERHETVEWNGQLLHDKILRELHDALGELPEEMFIFCTAPIKTLKSCPPPDLESFLKAQNDSGHSDHYRRWYIIQRKGKPILFPP